MTPTHQQVERSRERNRKRGIDRSFIAECAAPLDEQERARISREAAAAPPFRQIGSDLGSGPVVSIGGESGPKPPSVPAA